MLREDNISKVAVRRCYCHHIHGILDHHSDNDDLHIDEDDNHDVDDDHHNVNDDDLNVDDDHNDDDDLNVTRERMMYARRRPEGVTVRLNTCHPPIYYHRHVNDHHHFHINDDDEEHSDGRQ